MRTKCWVFTKEGLMHFAKLLSGQTNERFVYLALGELSPKASGDTGDGVKNWVPVTPDVTEFYLEHPILKEDKTTYATWGNSSLIIQQEYVNLTEVQDLIDLGPEGAKEFWVEKTHSATLEDGNVGYYLTGRIKTSDETNLTTQAKYYYHKTPHFSNQKLSKEIYDSDDDAQRIPILVNENIFPYGDFNPPIEDIWVTKAGSPIIEKGYIYMDTSGAHQKRANYPIPVSHDGTYKLKYRYKAPNVSGTAIFGIRLRYYSHFAVQGMPDDWRSRSNRSLKSENISQLGTEEIEISTAVKVDTWTEKEEIINETPTLTIPSGTLYCKIEVYSNGNADVYIDDIKFRETDDTGTNVGLNKAIFEKVGDNYYVHFAALVHKDILAASGAELMEIGVFSKDGKKKGPDATHDREWYDSGIMLAHGVWLYDSTESNKITGDVRGLLFRFRFKFEVKD